MVDEVMQVLFGELRAQLVLLAYLEHVSARSLHPLGICHSRCQRRVSGPLPLELACLLLPLLRGRPLACPPSKATPWPGRSLHLAHEGLTGLPVLAAPLAGSEVSLAAAELALPLPAELSAAGPSVAAAVGLLDDPGVGGALASVDGRVAFVDICYEVGQS